MSAAISCTNSLGGIYLMWWFFFLALSTSSFRPHFIAFSTAPSVTALHSDSLPFFGYCGASNFFVVSSCYFLQLFSHVWKFVLLGCLEGLLAETLPILGEFKFLWHNSEMRRQKHLIKFYQNHEKLTLWDICVRLPKILKFISKAKVAIAILTSDFNFSWQSLLWLREATLWSMSSHKNLSISIFPGFRYWSK